MPDNQRKARPGEPIRIDARLWNDLIDIVKQYKQGSFITRRGNLQNLLQTKLELLVLNRTGIRWDDVYNIVRLSGVAVTFDETSQYRISARPVVEAFIPQSENDVIAITQQTTSVGAGINPSEAWDSESVNDGGENLSFAIPAVISGLTVCRVRLNDQTHDWANPVPGEIDFLDSVPSCGQARIIDHVPIGDSGNMVLALVNLIGANPCGDSPEYDSEGSIVSSPEDTGAGGCCKLLAKLKSTDCLRAIGPNNTVTMYYDAGTWVSSEDITYDALSTGELVFWYESGRIRASLAGTELLFSCCKEDGSVEFVGGHLTGHIPEPSAGEDCTGDYFTINIKCVPCPQSEPIDNTYPCANAPSSLTYSVSPNCSPGIPSGLTMNKSGNTWTAGATTTCAPAGWQISITCTDDAWTWQITDGGGTYSGDLQINSADEDPFDATIVYTPGAGSCCEGIEQTINIMAA